MITKAYDTLQERHQPAQLTSNIGTVNDHATKCILLCVCSLQLVCLNQLPQSFEHLGYLLAVVSHPLAQIEALDMQVLEDPGLPGPGWRLTPHAPINHQL